MDFIFKVDPIRRSIKVPDAFTVLTMDHNIHKLVFICPYYEDFAFDSASIVFMVDAPDGKQYSIPAEEYESFPNSPAPYVKFTLTLKSYITSVVGYMSFCITADIISSGNIIEKSWHSKNITISIGGHINNDDSEDIPEEDVPTINQRLNNLDSKVGRLQTTVNGMANGTPPTASSTSEMDPDESTVYINTTDGKWYYYNGTAWTSGGTYGGAVTSTTFNQHGVPADDFAVGEALAEKADANDVGDLSQLETTAKDNLVSAINETLTGLNGRLADVKSAINFTSSSLLHIDHTGTYNYSNFVQGIRRANNHDFIANVGNRCTTGVVFTLLSGDAVSITNNVSEQEVYILTDSTGSGWKSGSFNYIVPTDGIYWAIVRNNDDSAIAPSNISATIEVAAQTLAVKTSEKIDSITERIKNIDGYYCLIPSNFEIGTMQITANGWNYPDGNTQRVRTKAGITYHLYAGDVVALSDYTNARFYLGWKNGNDEYKTAGWKTNDYTITESGDYVILLANVTEITQDSIYGLFNLLSIKASNCALTEIDNELFNALVYDKIGIPFTANEAYISSNFNPNQNRISFDVPYPFYKGSKIDITVGTGEKFYLMYFKKVNNTGNKNTDYEHISGSGTGWQTTNKSYTATEDVYVYVSAAFTADTAITKDTVQTKAVITKAHASEDTDALPSYWETYLQTKNGLINSAMDAVGGNGDAFVFYTDPHWGIKNQKHTPKIIQNMLENTALRSVYCGGDVIDGGSGGFSEYCKAFRGITVFTARGNHDQNPIATDPTNIVPDSEYYNRILKPIEYLVNTDGKLYFYRDNTSEKIRYIFMDSGSNRADTLNTEQLTWMQNALTSLSSDWSALVIQHIVFNGAEASMATLSFAGQGNKTIAAINAIYSQLQCEFIGVISGHVHRDYAVYDATYGYPIIATSCDLGSTGRTDYDPDNVATVGTTDEQIMDVFVIDKINKTINTIRIGAGQDRTFSYGS